YDRRRTIVRLSSSCFPARRGYHIAQCQRMRYHNWARQHASAAIACIVEEEGPMPRLSRLLMVTIMATLLGPTLLVAGPRSVAAYDVGFQDDLVTEVGAPTALAFTPDGRMLITTQPGQLRVYQSGTLLPTPALDLAAAGKICSQSERGLLGLAVDPQFA